MKLTATVKLNPTPEQQQALLETLQVANQCANWMSEQAFQSQKFKFYDLHNLVYYEAKARFDLAAQVVVRLIAKVSGAYKLGKLVQRTFHLAGSIAYDDRILHWYVDKQTVSIWTIQGRMKIPFQAGEKQLHLLQHRKGESDLILHRGRFHLAATCDIDEPGPSTVDDYLGVDLGVVNIASDSDRKHHSGGHVNNIRRTSRNLRSKLQACQTRSAKRKLKKLSGREQRFARDVNHCISKQIVAKAERTGRGVAIEDLKGIRSRIRAGRKQRAVLHSWAFYQLRRFISYKAQRVGVPLVLVDPKNTSRMCSCCGHIAKENRSSQSVFRCVSCGHEDNADFNAAENIRRAAVNRPIVTICVAA